MPLDPVVAALFENAVKAGRPALSAGSPADARTMVAAQTEVLGSGPGLFAVTDLAIEGRSGPIPARLYRPSERPAGLVLYFHGGGWVVGRLEDHEAALRTLADRSGCAILAVDYRLAPEHPFPAAVDDACDAFEWVGRRGGDLVPGLRSLVVAGDSAGANLAIGACLDARKHLPVAAQILIYPVVDTPGGTASYRTFDRDYGLTRADMDWFFGHYAPADLHGDPRVSPLRRADIGGSPPTIVVTAECDVLRDEGEIFARRLEGAGIPVSLRRAEGLPHGFIRLLNLVERADAELTALAIAIRRACDGEAL